MRDTNGSGIGYIPAIDGLRAVAVVSVMLFHLNATLLPGGFAGVDVFFVISGFVVTGSLMGQRFRRLRDLLLQFYARRLIRIMPALIVMLLLTTLLYALFVPDAWLTQSTEAVAKAAFFGLSNIQLMLEDDAYFSPRAEFNPFTHTWSLGVEEQFYLAFPFLVFWHQRQTAGTRSRRLVVAAVAALSVASLLACAWLTGHHPKAAFYSIPSRFWELGVGMVLCLLAGSWTAWLRGLPRRAVRALSVVSAGLIAAAFAVPASGHFPFPLALLPVAGTAGVIAVVCADRRGWVCAALSARPMVGIGRLSYSLYLWHWPVFVLCRWTIGLEGVASSLVALLLAVAAGALSFRVVECPIRHNGRLARLPRGWVVAGALLAVLGAWKGGTKLLYAKNQISLSQTARAELWHADDRTPVPVADPSCLPSGSTDHFAGGDVHTWRPGSCPRRRTQARLFVIGDSHSLVYIPSLRRFAAEQGVEVQLYTKAGCGFIALDKPMATAAAPRCRAYHAEAVERVLGAARAGDVVFLPSLRLARFADQWGGVAADATAQDDDPPRDGFGAARASAIEEGRALIARIRSRGVSVLFAAPTPLFRSPAFRCSDWFNAANPVCEAGLSVARDEMEDLRAPVLAAMRTIAATDPAIGVWDPLPLLCPGATCSAVTPAGPLFFDGDHLSGHANAVLYPDLSRSLLAMLSAAARDDVRPEARLEVLPDAH